jgi:transposase
MPRNLSKDQRQLSKELILSGGYSNKDIAGVLHCTERTIQRHREKLRLCGRLSGFPNPSLRGRDLNLSKPMIAGLIRRLCEKPDMYLDEMAWFIWDEFHVVVSTSTLSRTLRRVGWSKKQVR